VRRWTWTTAVPAVLGKTLPQRIQQNRRGREHDVRRLTNRMTRSRFRATTAQRYPRKTGNLTEMSTGIQPILVGRASGMIDRMPHHGTLSGIGIERKRMTSTSTRVIAMIGGMEDGTTATTTITVNVRIGRQAIRKPKALKGEEAVRDKKNTTLKRQRSTRFRQDLSTNIAGTLPFGLASITTKARGEISVQTQLALLNRLARHVTLPLLPREIVEEKDPVRYHLPIANDHVQGAGEDTRDQAALPPVDIATGDEADRRGRPLPTRVGGKGESGNMTPLRKLVEAPRPKGPHVPKSGIEKRQSSP
jgi:hypothetical protein